ncbi:glycine zipper domain-containing protein [Streptomyces sp. NPDC048420]|uniref:glycine zipper domain-containing protein n=1 Tax=Streptomyces sp. NPDC048420 TaxID=3155755 RepID=UPI00343A8FB6
MSQPPPYPPPPQPQQQPQGIQNPYLQPGYGPSPVPGQAPSYPAPAFPPPQPQPFAQRPATGGNPVGAIVLGLAVSVLVSLLYTGLIAATYKEQSVTVANTLYLAHALVNGAVVGALIGRMAGRNTGAAIGAAVTGALGAFFGYVNALPLIIAVEETPLAAWQFLQAEPFFPAKAWWNDEASGGVDWFSPLGLVVAGVAAWGLAYAIGNRRRVM